MQKHSDSCEELKRPVCPFRHCFVKKTLVHAGWQCSCIFSSSIYASPLISSEQRETEERAGCQNPPFHSAEMFVASVLSSRKSINDFHLLHFLLLIWTLKQFAKEPVLKAPYKFWDMCSFICQTSETRCLDIAGWGFFLSLFSFWKKSHYRI